MSWISIKDNLPTEMTPVLATGFDYGDCKNKRHYVVASRVETYWYDEDDVDSEFKYLTHWQPLPSPPKEVN